MVQEQALTTNRQITVGETVPGLFDQCGPSSRTPENVPPYFSTEHGRAFVERRRTDEFASPSFMSSPKSGIPGQRRRRVSFGGDGVTTPRVGMSPIDD